MARVRGSRAVVAGVCAIAMGSTGCSLQGATGTSPTTVVVTETVATVTGTPPAQGGVGDPDGAADAGRGALPASPSAPPAALSEAIAGAPAGAVADLEAVVDSVPGNVGIAVAPVGAGGEVRTAGTWRTGVAWSTVKVPLAIAAARLDPQVLEASTAAITVSDNQSAETLWNSLGGGSAAAAAVQRVLTDGGDSVSQVPADRTRDGYSVFGQTNWSLVDQSRFGSRLPCLGSSARVVHLMGQISPDQDWGLGRIPGARFKGGWGPGEAGGYLVRQFGLVPGAGGDVAVAMAVDAASFEAGAAALSAMADALAPRLAGIPGGVC